MRDKEETSLVPRPSGELARIPPGPRAIHDSMVNDATEIIRAREAISLSEAEATAWNEAAITELKDQDLRAIALAAKARLEAALTAGHHEYPRTILTAGLLSRLAGEIRARRSERVPSEILKQHGLEVVPFGEVRNGDFLVTGNTHAVKDKLKAIPGAQWMPGASGWLYTTDPTRAIIKALGIKKRRKRPPQTQEDIDQKMRNTLIRKYVNQGMNLKEASKRSMDEINQMLREPWKLVESDETTAEKPEKEPERTLNRSATEESSQIRHHTSSKVSKPQTSPKTENWKRLISLSQTLVTQENQMKQRARELMKTGMSETEAVNRAVREINERVQTSQQKR